MGGGGGSGRDGRKGVQFVAAHVRGIQFIVEQADGLHAEVHPIACSHCQDCALQKQQTGNCPGLHDEGLWWW